MYNWNNYDAWLIKEAERNAPYGDEEMPEEERNELNDKINELSWEIRMACMKLECKNCDFNEHGKCVFGTKPTDWEW